MEENGDDHSRLLLAPMVKSAVLAMNATDDILHEVNCGETALHPEGKPEVFFRVAQVLFLRLQLP